MNDIREIPVRRLFGLPLAALTVDEVVSICHATVAAGDALTIGVVNAAKIVKMRQDARLRASVVGSDLILADGMAVVWASRLLGRGLPERVAGIDLFESLVAQAERFGHSVYLLGATDDTLRALVERLRARHPRLIIAGQRNGYFTPAEEAAVAEEIRSSDADYLFVGITTPKKELFLERWGRSLGIRVCHGVGGSFDVLAGKVQRAPLCWQKLGLEWLYRVVQEPRRLWRRYLVTNTLFLGLLVKELVARTPALQPDVGTLVPSARRSSSRSEALTVRQGTDARQDNVSRQP